jgi:glyoxylase-like metal-dependent hydrolase (beta-lactamase superfamily II)
MSNIISIDLFFQNHFEIIAAYLIPYPGGAVLVESGPGTTLANLLSGLREHGVDPKTITDVLLTHIHLDHAGAAGWFATQGARVYVHPLGLPHLVNPVRLLDSARRVYGDRLESLWGKFWPVSQANLVEVADEVDIEIGKLHFTALHTPGHASHHIAYLFEDTCFSGDVGGIRMPKTRYTRLPYVLPETDLRQWRESLNRLLQTRIGHIAPTHFGVFENASAHFARALQQLDELEGWLEATMADDPPVEVLRSRYLSWLQGRERDLGITDGVQAAYELAAPAYLSADGLFRYWHKVRTGP